MAQVQMAWLRRLSRELASPRPPEVTLPELDAAMVTVVEHSAPIDVHSGFPWCMNVLAVAPRANTLLLGVDSSLHAYDLDPLTGVATKQVATIPVDGGPSCFQDVTSVRAGWLGISEVFVAVSTGGSILVVDAEQPTRQLVRLSHDVSTWGVAMHRDLRLLAVSNNDHEIRVVDLMDHSSMSDPDAGWPGPAPEYHRLLGHEHNIPAIDISACGTWLVSASIDGTCRLWERASGECVAVAKPSRDWGWGAFFVPVASVWRLAASPLNGAGAEREAVLPSGTAPDGAHNDLVVYLTKKTMFLLAHDLRVLAKHTVRARPAYGLPVDQLARLTMHRYVPEMGLLIIGSQGHSYVDLFYVASWDTDGQREYAFLPASAGPLPQAPVAVRTILSGLDYVPLRAGSTFTGIRLYLYFFSSTVGVYDIRYRDATIVGQGVPALAVDEVLL